MNKHLLLNFIIVVLVVCGLLIDGFQSSDPWFALATVIWIYQKEIEKKF